MAYDEKRDTLYVADENLDLVYVHDGKTLKRRRTTLKAGSKPVHVAISSDASHLAVTNRYNANLSLYDLEKKSANANRGEAIDLRREDHSYCHPYDVIFSDSSDICYVTDLGNLQDPLFPGGLMVVDIKRRLVTDRIRVGNNPFGMVLDEKGTTAYVCNFRGSSVYIVDLCSKRLSAK